MVLSLRKNGLTSLFKEVRVFKAPAPLPPLQKWAAQHKFLQHKGAYTKPRERSQSYREIEARLAAGKRVVAKLQRASRTKIGRRSDL